jgi:hypothetical protein
MGKNATKAIVMLLYGKRFLPILEKDLGKAGS